MPRTRKPSDHHSVYVVYLRNPKGDGKAGYYVGMTGLPPEERFKNHKIGYKSASIVTRCGERLVPRLYQHLNPMPYAKAVWMEVALADSLRALGAEPILIPTIEIVGPTSFAPLDAALARLDTFHWLLFTSANSV